MNEPNKGIQGKEEASKSKEGVQTAVSSNGWRRLMSKKWAFPAIYMASAAIILTFMWVYQDWGKNSLSTDKVTDQAASNKLAADFDKSADALPVTANAEVMQWPVKDRGEVEETMKFFDTSASNEGKQAAIIQYNDTYTPHTGIDLARKDDKPFDVMAALSGKVTAVEQNPIVGNLVEITHSNGMVTIYQSLGEVKVTKGAEVKKGDVIAIAGRNDFEKDDGVHLHFEVRQGQDGPALNPEQLLAAH